MQAKNTPDLDAIMLTSEMAEWVRLSEREVIAKSKGRKPRFIGFWLNQRTARWNKRMNLAHMAAQAGMSPEVIAASFGIEPVKK